MNADKTVMRRTLLARREALSAEARAQASAAITALALARIDELGDVSAALVYWTMRSEVDTRPLIAALAKRGISVAMPNTMFATHTLRPVWLAAGATPLAGRWGVPEVPAEQAVDARLDEKALVIAPGVGFDRAGRRLGYGAGYYDRLLSGELTGRRAWGVGYGVQCVDELPTEAHDQTLDAVICEDGWWKPEAR